MTQIIKNKKSGKLSAEKSKITREILAEKLKKFLVDNHSSTGVVTTLEYDPIDDQLCEGTYADTRSRSYGTWYGTNVFATRLVEIDSFHDARDYAEWNMTFWDDAEREEFVEMIDDKKRFESYLDADAIEHVFDIDEILRKIDGAYEDMQERRAEYSHTDED